MNLKSKEAGEDAGDPADYQIKPILSLTAMEYIRPLTCPEIQTYSIIAGIYATNIRLISLAIG